MQAWIVGRVSRFSAQWNWQFQGVFTTEAKAVAACIDETFFVAPAVVDEEVPYREEIWPGAYYPKAKTQQEQAV